MNGAPTSGVIGGMVVIDPAAAAVLSRGLMDWRRLISPQAPPELVARVELAVAAMRDGAAGYLAKVEAQRLAVAASEQTQGKPGGAESEGWIPTSQAASVLGLTPQRVRQLANERKLESRKAGGRLYFRRGQVLRRARTTAS